MKILGLHGDQHQQYNGKNGAIMGFDPSTGRYSVHLVRLWRIKMLGRKVVVLSDKAVGLAAEGATILLLKQENVELHPDQTLVCLAFSSSRHSLPQRYLGSSGTKWAMVTRSSSWVLAKPSAGCTR